MENKRHVASTSKAGAQNKFVNHEDATPMEAQPSRAVRRPGRKKRSTNGSITFTPYFLFRQAGETAAATASKSNLIARPLRLRLFFVPRQRRHLCPWRCGPRRGSWPDRQRANRTQAQPTKSATDTAIGRPQPARR